jgi:hypothetical protein
MFKKRTLEEKIVVRINKSKTNAFIPSDFFDLSDRDQTGRVLRKLVNTGFLIKLGQGVFAKTKESPVAKKRILAASFPEIVKEALEKLKVKTFPSQAERDYNSGQSTQIPTGLTIAVNSRISRTFTYNGRSIKYERIVQ